MNHRDVGLDITREELSDEVLDAEGETGVSIALPNPDGEYANELQAVPHRGLTKRAGKRAKGNRLTSRDSADPEA